METPYAQANSFSKYGQWHVKLLQTQAFPLQFELASSIYDIFLTQFRHTYVMAACQKSDVSILVLFLYMDQLCVQVIVQLDS